jgi:TonB-linked SusC/RagA family outer membrane protein
MRKILSLLTVMLLTALVATAQTREITGRVVDEQGQPVDAATVLVKGSTSGVAANANGSFRINAKTGDVLVFSATNFATKEVTVTASGTINVTLNRQTRVIDEVVVTALGVQRQAKELGYSTQKVRASELTQAKVVNLQNGLTGKVSGLNVQTVNNSVFGDTRITLRGIRSLTGNNQPMLILDGVPIGLGFISSINPNDIQDVTILKSSSATAIYGPDGVNGAIVVTTKKGNRNRPTVTFSHTTQFEQVSYMPKLQTRFGSGSSVDANGFGVYDPIENQGYGDEFDGSLRPIGRSFDRNGDGDADDPGETQMVTYEARPKEKKKFWDIGTTNQTDVSFSTGDFYLSAQNVNIKGILPKDENNRVAFRLSANKEYGKFRAGFNVNYTQQNYNINAGSSFGNGRDYTPYWNLINTPMQIPISTYSDWQNDYWSHPNQYFNDYYSNPYFMIDNFRSRGRTDDLFGNLELNFKAASWLNFTYRLGGTISNGTSKTTQGAYTYSDYSKNVAHKTIAASGDLTAAVADASAFNSRLNSEIFATARKDFGTFSLEGLLGQSFREVTSKSTNVSSTNLGIPSVFNILVRKGEPGATEFNSKTRLERYFGRVQFGYDKWAFLELTGSFDRDSRLANPYNYKPQDISFFYPGASASVVLSEAIPAIKNSKQISYLKVRGAWSKTGNVNLGAYSLENTFSPGGNFPYGTLLGFTSDNTLRKDTYKPEFVVNKEVGMEISLLKNRVNFEATYYSQDNTDQIITVAYSAATGYPNALLNAASFTNKGLELDLRLTPLVTFNNVNIDFKVNYTHQTNEVTKLIEGVNELGIGNGNFVIVGQPAYTFRLTDYVRDSLGRVIVDAASGFPTVDPSVKTFGQTLPTHLLGLNLNVNWKSLTLGIVADYRSGNQIYSGIGPDMDFSGISYRSGQNGRMPFIFPNSSIADGSGKYVANTGVYTSGGYNFWSQAVNTSAQSNYIASAAFWKLREVSLSYILPNKWFNFTKGAVKSASFTLTGRNLFMWLPETNEWTDPEFSNTTGNAQGVNDRNNTPPTRLFGANFTFNF